MMKGQKPLLITYPSHLTILRPIVNIFLEEARVLLHFCLTFANPKRDVETCKLESLESERR